MRFILMTFSGPEHIEAWESSSVEDKQTEISEVLGWFGEHGAAGRIVGGEELGWPKQAKTVRKRGINDGPFIETKEMLGGFIVVEVPDEAAALEMARTWPGLKYDSDAVEVRPIGSSEAEADEQRKAECRVAGRLRCSPTPPRTGSGRDRGRGGQPA